MYYISIVLQLYPSDDTPQ